MPNAIHDTEGSRPRHELHVAGAVCRRTAGGESGAKGIERHRHVTVFMRVDSGIVKLRLTAVSDAQHDGFTTGSRPIS